LREENDMAIQTEMRSGVSILKTYNAAGEMGTSNQQLCRSDSRYGDYIIRIDLIKLILSEHV
jgi:hypothetical protein